MTNKLGFGEPSAGLLPGIHSQIKETKELLSSQVQDTRKVRLKTWKENLRRNPGAMGRWIKAFDTPKAMKSLMGSKLRLLTTKLSISLKSFGILFGKKETNYDLNRSLILLFNMLLFLMKVSVGNLRHLSC